MRINQLFLKLRWKLTALGWRKTPRHGPNRKYCTVLLEELSVKQFNYYNSSAGLARSLKVRYSNIEEYTRVIKEAIRFVKEEKPIPPDWFSTEETTVSLDRFFVSSTGYYLNVVDAVLKFKEASQALCKVMEQSDTATHGLMEHNLRMLTKLFQDIRDITTTLIEVSIDS